MGRLASLALFLTLSLAAETRPNLLLITLDTTRADALGCYGARDAATPVLDAIAAGGARFTAAHAHVPLTLPSHAVLLTGQLPAALQLPVNGVPLNASVPTLATHLAARGYATLAVVGAVILNRQFGLARGFGVYDDRMRGEERTADDVTAAALDAVKGIKQPFFLWVHYYDPHYRYRPPEPYATRFAKNPYLGEVAYMDAAIGTLLSRLREQRLLANTLIVVAGDHGEGLSRHGEKQHGVFLYEDTLHVPLLMNWQGRIVPRTIDALCGLADVANTILDVMGEGSLRKTDGVSLTPLLHGGTIAPRTLYIESYHGAWTYGWAPLRGVITDGWKFIDAPRPELYRWRSSEEKNLYAEERDEARMAKKALMRFAMNSADPARATATMTDETRKQLASLGYLAPNSGARAGALDPKDAIGIEDDLIRAKEMLDANDRKTGMRVLEDILKRNPENLPALSMLGIAHMQSGDYDRARASFEAEVHYRPELPGPHVNLGSALRKLGKSDAAIEEYRKALTLFPADADAAANLARMSREQRRTDEARRTLQRAFAAGADSADLRFELGLLEVVAQNWDAARTAFAKAAALDPMRDDAQVNLGKIAWQNGRVDEAITAYRRASRIAPGNAGYLATLGSLYLNGKNDLPQALAFYRQALRADPDGRAAGDLRDLIAKLEAQMAAVR